MNSLNILSARVSPPQSAAPSRSNSFGNALSLGKTDNTRQPRDDEDKENVIDDDETIDGTQVGDGGIGVIDEKTPLLGHGTVHPVEEKSRGWYLVPNRIASALITSIRWVVNALVAPGVYLISCLYNEEGHFAPIWQIRKLGNAIWAPSVDPLAEAYENSSLDGNSISMGRAHERSDSKRRNTGKSRRIQLSGSSSSGPSDSESDRAPSEQDQDLPSSRHTRSKSLQSTDEIAPARRSIRIKLHNEDSLRQRKQHRKTASTSSQSNGSGAVSVGEISPATLKSPTSPAVSLTKYPRAPAPPRPLIPRRMPSYTLPEGSGKPGQKTLVLDLDETLIHSMAKGGRMSTGHMVEVKLNTYIGVAGQPSIGPQHPILYYVHKRPHCDDFLRRVCQWYNLVVFTASVQEYADPVIDWLERERKFFSGRYYRQHCTYRHGAFIKDLSSVEPDLSKVMILDNSPLSYMFHQDNAIPIEGWINDPTDNDLIHLIPLLEGLQYVTDVRALLALRGGEDGKHMA